MLGDELEGDVVRLQGIAELEEIWGFEEGEILNAMIQSEWNEEE